jgi:hypothetical protein
MIYGGFSAAASPGLAPPKKIRCGDSSICNEKFIIYRVDQRVVIYVLSENDLRVDRSCNSHAKYLACREFALASARSDVKMMQERVHAARLVGTFLGK